MTTVVLLSQPFRLEKATAFLSDLPPGETAYVVTRDSRALDGEAFPPGVVVLDWAPTKAGTGRGGIGSTRAIHRAKRWIRSGTPAGARLERWLKLAEWRMRYIDRALIVLESATPNTAERRQPIEESLDRIACDSGIDRIVVFDLFDLPAALAYRTEVPCEVVVR